MLSSKTLSLFTRLTIGILSLTLIGSTAMAETMVPRTIDYQGTILDEANNPITTPLSFRFSFWSTGDYTAESLAEDGTINAADTAFTGYQEEQSITPDRNGNFQTAIGVFQALPDLNANIHRYLQVEVKATDAAATEYEILDIDGDTTNENDRRLLSSAPYAITSDAVDNSDIGYEAGNIPQLNDQGKIETSAIPEELQLQNLTVIDSINGIKIEDLNIESHKQNTDTGTEETTFVLNALDKEGDIRIQFGTLLNKGLKWAAETLRFEIGDTLHVWGDLTTDGTVNGRVLTLDGEKLDGIEAEATADQSAIEVPFTHETFQATNVFDALLGLKALILGNTELVESTSATLTTAIDTKASQADLESTAQQLSNSINQVQSNLETQIANTTNQAAIDSAFQRALDATNQARSDLQTEIQSTKDSLNDRIAGIESTLEVRAERNREAREENRTRILDIVDEKIAALESEQDSISENATKRVTTFAWSFLPGTDNRRYQFGSQFNKAFVAMRDGKITGISVASNPRNNQAAGAFVITKNDNGDHKTSAEMTDIELTKNGANDNNNTAYLTDLNELQAGLTFEAGDSIRAYHRGRDDLTSQVMIEIEYQ